MTKSSVIELKVVEVVEEVVVTRTEINPKASPPQNPYLEIAPGETYDFEVWVKNKGTATTTATVQLTQDGVDIPTFQRTFHDIPPGGEVSGTLSYIPTPASIGEYLIGARVI